MGNTPGGVKHRRASHINPMSVAFTKESDSEAVAADLPDRPISAEPNLVTPKGLAALDAELAAAKAAWTEAQADGGIAADRTAMARATRELRYWSARRASAQLIEAQDSETAVFGSTVTFERADGRRQTYAIVGEDEADPTAGSVSYVSPVARALIGKAVGDAAKIAGADVEVVAVA